MRELVENSKDELPQGFIGDFEILMSRFTESYKIQKSSERVLNFLVDDILDYAQIGAGNFRKRVTTFELQKSIDQILKIL